MEVHFTYQELKLRTYWVTNTTSTSVDSLQIRSGVVIKTPRKQRCGIIGTLLASVSALMILNKLLSGGLRNRRSGRGLINRTPNILEGYFPPVHFCRDRKRRTGGG